MRVLLVHLSDGHQGGGGGIAMYRLHLGLRKAGVDSRILCRTKTVDSPYVTELPRLPRVEAAVKKVTSRLGLNDIHLVSSFKVKQEEAFREADVIDFQGIHTQTLSYLALPFLTKDKPAVFTMHDMWAFTGHCVYSYDCERWKRGCGQCPYPDTHPSIKRDNTRLEWRLKNWVYNRSNLAFVARSQWLMEQVRHSMLRQFPLHLIPYGIDTDTFRPLDPGACRAKLGIPPHKKVLMFMALKLDNYRKGGDLLLKILQSLPTSLKAETVLLMIGHGGDGIAKAVGMETLNLGFVSDDYQKAVAYSAADLFLFPTRADIFGLVSIESQACATPVVAYDVGGVSEHVRPGLTGYLAEAESIADFRNGIVELLEDDSQRQRLGEQGRAITHEKYNLKVMVDHYIRLYNDLLQVKAIGRPGELKSPSLESHVEEKPLR